MLLACLASISGLLPLEWYLRRVAGENGQGIGLTSATSLRSSKLKTRSRKLGLADPDNLLPPGALCGLPGVCSLCLPPESGCDAAASDEGGAFATGVPLETRLWFGVVPADLGLAGALGSACSSGCLLIPLVSSCKFSSTRSSAAVEGQPADGPFSRLLRARNIPQCTMRLCHRKKEPFLRWH